MWTHEVPGGAGWSLTVPCGASVTLEALQDNASVSTLRYAAGNPLERLNVPDTLKAQMTGCVRPPVVLMSDLGRALCSVTGSSLDWHDAVTGHSLDRHVAPRFGRSDYATHGNEWRRSARALLLDELATLGLGRRDLHATVNWFVKVAPDGSGRPPFASPCRRKTRPARTTRPASSGPSPPARSRRWTGDRCGGTARRRVDRR